MQQKSKQRRRSRYLEQPRANLLLATSNSQRREQMASASWNLQMTIAHEEVWRAKMADPLGDAREKAEAERDVMAERSFARQRDAQNSVINLLSSTTPSPASSGMMMSSSSRSASPTSHLGGGIDEASESFAASQNKVMVPENMDEAWADFCKKYGVKTAKKSGKSGKRAR